MPRPYSLPRRSSSSLFPGGAVLRLCRVAGNEKNVKYLLDYLFAHFDVELSEDETVVRLKQYPREAGESSPPPVN